MGWLWISAYEGRRDRIYQQAVCDVFDALTSARYYKKGWSMEEAYTEIVSQSGKQFDPKVVLLFQAHFKEFKQIAEQNADKHIY